MRTSIRNLGIGVACFAIACVAGGAAGVAAAAGKRAAPVQKEAEAFLATVTGLIAPVSTSTGLVDWAAATDVTPEHIGERAGADKALAALIGSTSIIDKTKTLLKSEKQLDDLTVRQLRKLLLSAAEAPGTIPEVVARRVELEAKQSGILDGYTFCLQPKGNTCAKPITANDIDDILKKSRDLAERQRVWTVSKEIGRPLKPGLVELVKLRNQVAREMGYHSYFALKVADYGMTVDEMMKLLDDTLATTKPLYDGLHCWAKNQLATRYKRPAPRLIPAHWIGNRWAQSWPGLVEAASLDPFFKGASPESIVKSAESFYVSLGFPKLPPSFWERSDLYPVPPGVARKKNSHASAWHIDRAQDVRSLMSVRPQRAVVRHRAPRARAHLLLPLLQPAGGAVPAARGRQPRVSRSDRRAGQAGQPADPVPGEGGRHPRRQGAGRRRVAAAVRARVDRLPAVVGRDDEPLRTRPLRDRAAARRMADQVVGLRRRVPGRDARRRPRSRPVRRLHQDPHQRRRRRNTTTTRWRR